MENLKDKTVLVIGWGLEVEMCLTLAKTFKKVYYWTRWADAFPSSAKASIGTGLESFGVYKVNYMWDYVDIVDMICFFDTYGQDMVEYLRGKGYRVFGAGLGEFLETNRKYGREIQQAAGLPTQESKIVMGLKQLGDEIKKEGGYFVKLSAFRGDVETFFAKDYDSCKIYLDKLSVELGPRQDSVEFLLDKKIDGVEPGYDGFVVDGKYPNMGMWGWERKGSGYIGAIVNNDEIPFAIKNINDKLAPFFNTLHTRSIWSTELIVDDKGDGYLIDPTPRAPMPVGTAIHLEIWKNFAEFIWEAAAGNIIDLIPAFKFGAGTCLDSDWAGDNWLEVDVDPVVRQFVKFRQMLMSPDGKYFAVPGFSSVCSVIGLGNTAQEALDNLKINIKGISGFELQTDTGGINEILKSLEEGVSYGLPNFAAEGKK